MSFVLIALLACEADLTVAAAAIGLGLRGSRPAMTCLATAVVALGFALAVFALWALWFVAPACVINGCDGQPLPVSAFAYLGLGAGAQWLWMLGVALAARLARKRNLAHASG